jgi:hypothetical protein
MPQPLEKSSDGCNPGDCEVRTRNSASVLRTVYML